MFQCGRMVSRLAFSCHRLAKSKTKYRDKNCRQLISTRYYETIVDRLKVFFLSLQTLVIFLVFSASTYFKRCRNLQNICTLISTTYKMMPGFKKCMDFHFFYVLLRDKSGDILSFNISFGLSKMLLTWQIWFCDSHVNLVFCFCFIQPLFRG